MESACILHPGIEHISKVTGMGTQDLSTLFEKYDIFEVSFPDLDQSFICRGINVYEYNKIMTSYEDEGEIVDKVVSLCVIHPSSFFDSADENLAGLAFSIGKIIFEQSGLSENNAEECKQYLDKLREEMQLFSNQMPCIIHEAFPDMSIESILKLPFTKLAWYYTRAEWVLQTLRGLTKTEEAPQQGDDGEFDELKFEKAFREGKLRG